MSTTPPTTRAPPYSASSSAARASATTVISGSTPRSKRLAASLGSRCRRAVRATPVGSQCAASSRTAVVPSPISVDAPPMTAARPIGPVSSVISRSSVGQLPRDAVQGGELLALAGQPDGDRPGDGVAVEGVHRLAELEHHVVGDVDGQGDAADGGLREPAAHPPRARRGRVEPLHRDHREAVAALGVGDGHLPGGLARPGRRGDRARVAPRGGQAGAHLAGDPAHGQAVAAVGGDGQLDDDVVQPGDRAGGRARRRDVGAVAARARGCRRGRRRCRARGPSRSSRRRRGRRSSGRRSRSRRAARRRAARRRRCRRRRSCARRRRCPAAPPRRRRPGV